MMRAFRLVFCIALFVATALAQKTAPARKAAPASPDKLLGLKVTGTTRYSEKEILAACGLQIGQDAADADFREASRKLGDSGLFSDIVYTYTSGSSGVKVEFQLTGIGKEKLVPVQFDNFVWMADAELLAELEKRVPLFNGLLPLAGGLADRVSDALQAILAEKHVAARVDYLRDADQEGRALHEISYHVEEINIAVHGLEFPGASPEQAALLASASRRAIGSTYQRSGLAAVARFDLLPVYLQRGYLKASFGNSEARVLTATSAASDSVADVQVDAIIPVKPGSVYSTSAVEWRGNSVVPTQELNSMLHLPAGQPADAVRLQHDLDATAKLYRSRGYMAVKITPEAGLDDSRNTVHYSVTVAEGDQYKMGELEILGLDTQAKARLQEAWKLRAGEPYNGDYLKKFLSEAGPLLPRGIQWSTSVHETTDAKDKTVDVEIRFKP